MTLKPIFSSRETMSGKNGKNAAGIFRSNIKTYTPLPWILRRLI